MTHHPYSEANDTSVRDLARLDSASAHGVIEEARHMARAQWLRLQIRVGEDSGEPIDGEAAMAARGIELTLFQWYAPHNTSPQ